MTDIYMDWDEPGAGTLFRGDDDMLHISLDVDWSDTDHPIIPPDAHDFLNELLAMPARIATLEAALKPFAEAYGMVGELDLLPGPEEPFRRAAEVLARENGG